MESNLTLKKADFEAEVADNAGWGTDPDGWDAEQTSVVSRVVKSGTRQFYYPPLVNGRPVDWSFLHPVSQITLPSGEAEIDLPDDFGGIEGSPVLVRPESSWCGPLKVVGVGAVLEAFAEQPSRTGSPYCIAVTPLKGTTLTQGRRYRLRVFPAPDQDYTVRLQYFIHAGALTGERPFAYGGPEHSETLLESCLQIFEERHDDIKQGPHWFKFMERLAASVALDRRVKPRALGVVVDPGEREGRIRPYPAPVTVDGVLYD